MSLGMAVKIRTGIVQPVGHQSSIVLNTRAQYGLVGKRMNNQVLLEKDDEAGPDAKKRKGVHMIPNPRNDWVTLLTVFMHELAFRDPPDFTFSARESSVHISDTEVFTSFNHRIYDDDNLPVFLGVVDRGQKPHPREADTESTGVVVAMQGTRSTYNTSHQTIHVGDSVYWDIPECIEEDGRLVPDRPQIDGVPDDKLLAITVNLPQAWSSAFRLSKLISRQYRDYNDLYYYITTLQGIPRFLHGPVLTALSIKNGWGVPAQYVANAPAWFPEFTKTNDLAVGAGELADLVNRRLLSHWIGTAYNTALPGQQFDIMLRG